jgi:hypothetical protein
MSSVENTNMSTISMEELIAIGEYFSGNMEARGRAHCDNTQTSENP